MPTTNGHVMHSSYTTNCRVWKDMFIRVKGIAYYLEVIYEHDGSYWFPLNYTDEPVMIMGSDHKHRVTQRKRRLSFWNNFVLYGYNISLDTRPTTPNCWCFGVMWFYIHFSMLLFFL